ncbi:MAG TPA: hypothetical protein VFF53_10970 [Geobacteraceae bacterium]|nr:hypothetical protein [Geobacteraceae bacterium]
MKPVIVFACLATLPGHARKYTRPYHFLFACFLVTLVTAGVTGIQSLHLPAAIFLTLAIYFRAGANGLRQLRHMPLSADETAQDLRPHADHPELLTEGTTVTSRRATDHSAVMDPPDVPAGFSRITFHNRTELRFATATGSRLTIGAGTVRGVLRMELYPGQSAGEEMDTIDCRLQVADSTGHSWECRQLMLPFLLTDPIEPGAALPSDGFSFCSEAPASWREALESNCLIASVQNLLDTRDVGQLTINGIAHQIFFKRQKPLVDVAYLDSAASFLVRISRLTQDIHINGEFAGSATLPPFCYTVPAEELLFLTSPHHYYSYYEEWYAMEEGERKKSPLFTGLHRKDTPQHLVRLVD